MDEKPKPSTQSKGQLVPPNKRPPTAVGTGTPGHPTSPRPGVPQARSAATVERYIRRWLGALIDLADRTANRMFNLPFK
jgi:hypothetical protein